MANQATITYKVDPSTTAKALDSLSDMKVRACKDFDGALGETAWDIMVGTCIARGGKCAPKPTRGPEFGSRSSEVNLGKLGAFSFTIELGRDVSSGNKLGPGLALVGAFGTMVGEGGEFEEFFKYCRHQVLLFLSTGQ